MKTFSLLARRWTRQGAIQLIRLGGSLLLGVAVVSLPALPVAAAERIVFTYGPIGRSIPIRDLETLAETGKATRQLQWYLRVAKLKPETLQQVLTQKVSVSQRLIDRVTYSLPGEYLLYQTGKTIHTRSRQANIQAIRAALLLSTSQDNQLSLLEFLQNYPTQELYVNGVSLLRLINDVNRVIDRIEPIVAAVETFLEGLVCDCENNSTAVQSNR
jgi:hypothetical protein